MARLNCIQWAVASKPSNFLLNLEKELVKELDTILSHEGELWALKSQVNWMIQGPKNTAFYHVSTLVRRKRNHILAIKNAVGEWIYEDNGVKEHIRDGFKEIFTSSFLSVPRVASSAS